MINKKIKGILFLIVIISLVSCKDTSISSNPKGIGPITQLKLPVINDSLMQVGQQLFKDKCAECHTMEYKNSGPDISDILAVRKPEWVMNFLLNKEEMLLRDSLSIYTRKKYEVACGSITPKEQEAREILEYLRIYQIWLHEFNALYK